MQELIGKTKKGAQDIVEAKNMIFRLVSIDGERFLGYPEDDTRKDRVCVEITNGKVSKSTIR